MYAIVVNDEFGCCGRSAKDWDQGFKIRKKRESETAGRRVSISPKDKANILRHQLRQCIYCGHVFGKRARVEYDHFIPFAFSGDNNKLNIIAACRECNRIKSASLFSSIEEARVYILNERERKGMTWADYLGGSYVVSKI